MTKRLKLISLDYEKSQKIIYYGEDARDSQYTFYKGKGCHIDGMPAKVNAVFEDEDGRVYSYEIREFILGYFGKNRISEKMAKEFKHHIDNGLAEFVFEDGQLMLNFKRRY